MSGETIREPQRRGCRYFNGDTDRAEKSVHAYPFITLNTLGSTLAAQRMPPQSAP
jgi:hypothetical protein